MRQATLFFLLAIAATFGFSMVSCGTGGGEVCDDGEDNDLDGEIDCDDPDCTVDATDADGDGYLVCDIPELSDCDDNNPDVHPELDEACDGEDSNCDGAVDNVDLDGDGYIAESCSGNDCNDGNALVFPGNPELCDGEDNDCNGEIDNGFDADDDGWTFCAGDCRDGDPLVNPDAEELCDGVDNNCDGDIDEAFDADGDGYIDSTNPFCEALYGPNGTQSDLGDCDDTSEVVRPGAHEDSQDGADNDCDGCFDECEDQDDDGYDNCAPGDPGDAACTKDTDDSGQNNDLGDDGLEADCVDTTLDYDFQAGVINPGVSFQVPNKEGIPTAVSEVCDGRDNNCDGEIDEGYDPKTCNPLF